MTDGQTLSLAQCEARFYVETLAVPGDPFAGLRQYKVSSIAEIDTIPLSHLNEVNLRIRRQLRSSATLKKE